MKSYARLSGDRPSLAPYLEGEAFLTLLTVGENTPMSFTFLPDRPTAHPGVSVLTGTLGECWATIEEKQRGGNGVFIPVNVLDGDRRAAHVTRLRALFIDVDEQRETVGILGASFVVHTGRGFHAYWLLDGTDPLPAFRPAQKALATFYGSDPAVCDLARLMRLPGTLHLKREHPTRVRMGVLPDLPVWRYTIDEVLTRHGLRLPDEAPPPLPTHADGNVRMYQAWASKKEVVIGARNRTAYQIAADGFRRNLPEAAIQETLNAFCRRAGIENEAETIFRSAARQKRS